MKRDYILCVDDRQKGSLVKLNVQYAAQTLLFLLMYILTLKC